MRRTRIFLGSCFAIFIAPPLHSQDNSGSPAATTEHKVILWKDLYFQQDVTDVAAVLGTYPEVRSAKPIAGKSAKPPSIKIKLTDSKFQVFGIGFEVKPDFSINRELQSVTLLSGNECANQSVEKSKQIQDTLVSKYGGELSGVASLDINAVRIALAQSVQSGAISSQAFFYADSQIAGMVDYGFQSTPRPAAYYGGLAGSLSQLAVSLWGTTQKECAGTGNQRVAYAIKYMPRATFDLEMKRAKDGIEKENNQASQNL